MPGVPLKRISKKSQEKLQLSIDCTLGGTEKPVLSVRPGETFEVETWDCFGGYVTPERPLSKIIEEGIQLLENLVTGPIEIIEAEPRDTLVLDIIRVEIPSRGVTTVVPGFGALEGWLSTLSPRTRFSEIRENMVEFKTTRGVVKIEVKPFVGTIGVSPQFESVSTITPGPHGGNMDCPDISPGNRLLLPVFRRRALLGLGDVHAVQGDGEICGTAIEINSTVTLKADLIKSSPIRWPRLESAEFIATICSARPLEDAARHAFLEMIRWLEESYNFERNEAYEFLSNAAKVRVAQIVDPLYTVEAILSKKFLSKHC